MTNEAADWKEKMKWWDNGINLLDKETTQDDIKEYGIIKIYIYRVDDATDAELWDIFRDEFKNWIKDTFNNLTVRQLGVLCQQLSANRIFILQNIKSFTLAETLITTLTEEERYR